MTNTLALDQRKSATIEDPREDPAFSIQQVRSKKRKVKKSRLIEFDKMIEKELTDLRSHENFVFTQKESDLLA